MTTPLWRRVLRLDVGRHVERDVNQEIAFHIDMRTRKLVAGGMDPAEAAAKAIEQFGDVPAVRDECLTIGHDRERHMQWSDRISAIVQDARYAARALRNQPSFSLTVILVLGLGIGANTSIFAVIDALLLRTLPVPHAEQLVTIGDPSMVSDAWMGSPQTDFVSYPVYADLRDHNTVLSGIYAAGPTGEIDVVTAGASASDDVDHPSGRLVSGSYFSVLGVPAFIGRTFTAAEDKTPLGDPVAVISYGYWQRRFGGERSAIGSTMNVNGTTFSIIGVTPPTFAGDIVGQRIAVWLPMMMQPAIRAQRSLLDDRSVSWLLMMGRLAPGVSLAQAQAQIATIERQSIRGHLSAIELSRFDEDPETARTRVEPGARGFSRYRAAYGPTLGILMAAVVLVVLIVCANVANLMLARSAARGREMTVRMAIGAGRGRLIQQLLTESVLVAGIAGILGVVTSVWGSRLLLAIAGGSSTPIPLDVAPNGRVVLFTAGVTLLASLVFGLLPALRATRVDVATALRAHGRSLTGSRGRFGRFGAGRALVVGQVALSTLLLIGTGLLARSMTRIFAADLGFKRERLIVVDVSAWRSGYEGDRRGALLRDLAERLERVPGVESVSSAGNGVFSGGVSEGYVTVPGFIAQADSDGAVLTDVVGPRHFQTIGAQIARGRDFDARDAEGAEKVAVINETMAKRYFRDRDPIGQSIQTDSTTVTVVGVVRDVESQDVRAKPARTMYLSMFQQRQFPRAFVLEVRVAAAPAAFVGPLRSAIREVDAKLRFDVEPVDDLVRASVAQDVLVAQVTTFFGIVALLLTAIGVYGITAYATAQRTGELGLRSALGAEPGGIMRMILGEAMTLGVIGVGVGLPAGLAATRLIRGRLFGVSAIDVPSLSAVDRGVDPDVARGELRPGETRGACRSARRIAIRLGRRGDLRFTGAGWDRLGQ